MYERAKKLFKTVNLKECQIGHVPRRIIEKSLSLQNECLVPVGVLPEKKCIQVWKNVNSPFLFNSQKDLAWKTVHNCLPTKVFFIKRKYSKNEKCPKLNCNEDESISHLFWSCCFSQKVWELLRPWLSELHRAPTENDILYGEVNSVECAKCKRWWAAINCVKEGIWRGRNLIVFKKYSMSPDSIVKVSLTMVWDYTVRDRGKYTEKEINKLWRTDNAFIKTKMF